MTEQGKWICPNPKCKAENGPDFVHCRLCGEHNPNMPVTEHTCAKCGFKTDKNCSPSCNSPMFLNL